MSREKKFVCWHSITPSSSIRQFPLGTAASFLSLEVFYLMAQCLNCSKTISFCTISKFSPKWPLFPAYSPKANNNTPSTQSTSAWSHSTSALPNTTWNKSIKWSTTPSSTNCTKLTRAKTSNFCRKSRSEATIWIAIFWWMKTWKSVQISMMCLIII